MNNIAQILINLRMSKGLSQEDLSRQLNKDINIIRSWESGTMIPNSLELDELTRFYEVDINGLTNKTSVQPVPSNLYDQNQSRHKKHKIILRVVGLVMLAIGLPLLITGIVLFSIDFNNMSFEYAQIPFFLIGPGSFFTMFGFFFTMVSFGRSIARYTKNENIAIKKEAYQELKPELQDMASTFRGDKLGNDTVPCPKCGTKNDAGDKFCKKCGEQLSPTKVCPVCGATIDNDSKFCPKCGRPVN